MKDDWLDKVNWAQDGLVPAVVQEAGSGKVLTVAWMNREALGKTVASGEAHYWSRSRRKLWRQGEESGHVQEVKAVYVDCDLDTLVIEVVQHGAACHDGYRSCFYRRLSAAGDWEVADQRLVDPKTIYKTGK